MFNKRKIRSLLKLLAQKDQSWGETDPSYVQDFVATSRVPNRELLEIYSRRMESAGDRYSGFDELIEVLSEALDEASRVHSFTMDERSYFVFTDARFLRVIAVLAERL